MTKFKNNDCNLSSDRSDVLILQSMAPIGNIFSIRYFELVRMSSRSSSVSPQRIEAAQVGKKKWKVVISGKSAFRYYDLFFFFFFLFFGCLLSEP